MNMKKSLLKCKRGVFDQITALAIGLVTVGLVLAVVFLIFSNLLSNSTVAADGNATAALTQTVTSTNNIPTFLPVIVIVAIGGLLIGLVSFIRGRR